MKEKAFLSSPIGTLEIYGGKKGVESITFLDDTIEASESEEIKTQEVLQCYTQLKEYFEGERKEFDLKLNPDGTPFQNKIWDLLRKIPFGKTMSYNQLTHLYGNLKSIRAVANANARNKLPIVIPCHRVIGANGSLTGYAGGLKRKKWLLEFEASGGSQMEIF